MEGFDGGEEACSARRAAGGVVLLDLTASGFNANEGGVAVPEMFTSQ